MVNLGQKAIGTNYTMREWQHVLDLQTQLRKNGLLKNVCAEEEMEKFNGGTEKNDMVKVRDPEYVGGWTRTCVCVTSSSR